MLSENAITNISISPIKEEYLHNLVQLSANSFADNEAYSYVFEKNTSAKLEIFFEVVFKYSLKNHFETFVLIKNGKIIGTYSLINSKYLSYSYLPIYSLLLKIVFKFRFKNTLKLIKVLLATNTSIKKNKKIFYFLSFVSISMNERNKGYGSYMLSKNLKIKNNDILLSTQNESGITFFSKNGFKIKERKKLNLFENILMKSERKNL